MYRKNPRVIFNFDNFDGEYTDSLWIFNFDGCQLGKMAVSLHEKEVIKYINS